MPDSVEKDVEGRTSRKPVWDRAWKYYLWSLPVLLAVGYAFYASLFEIRIQEERSALLASRATVIAILSESITSIQRTLNRLAVVARSIQLSATSMPSIQALTAEMATLSSANPDYYQLRWIDETGRERIRLDQNNRTIAIIPPERLQMKSDRYYFVESIALKPGSIYVSPLDLNIERGAIEIPFRPVVRIARRIPDGILIVNVDFRIILNRIREAASSQQIGVMILNDEGYYLLGGESEKEWGFQLNHPEHRIEMDDPGLWAAINVSHSGEFVEGHSHWMFSRFSIAESTTSMDSPVVSPSWMILARVQSPDLPIRLEAFLITSAAFLFVSMVVLFIMFKISESQLDKERATRDLALAEERLAKSERLSSLGMMLAGMSHELNTPIGAALLAATAVRDSFAGNDPSGKLSLGLRLVIDSLERAAKLLRTFKQLATDRATAEKRTFYLREVVDDILAALHVSIKQSRHNIEVQIPGEIKMTGYPGALGQVIQNLVQNAIKHAFITPDGTIRITAEKRNDSVWLSVKDNGVGMRPEILSRIFEPFFTTRRQSGGMGLGLHLCHQLVVGTMGGSITAKSELRDESEESGTEFVIVLPIQIKTPEESS